MQKITEIIEERFKESFKNLKIDNKYLKVVVSNRPDLCEYQCNAALSVAKSLGCTPIELAQSIIDGIKDKEIFKKLEVCAPGFINIDLNSDYLAKINNLILKDTKHGVETTDNKENIIIDYGGPNIAKPLHVGHLRSAVIGESIKRILRFKGNKVVGDIHLGDYGLQMGLVINELNKRYPNLCYFDELYSGEYPKEPFFTIKDLEEIYPTASKKSKEDENYYKESLEFTKKLQEHVPGIRALWEKIVEVSMKDLKANYDKLFVDFDLWYGEASASEYIDELVEYLTENNYAYKSDGALVVDIKEDTDVKEIPPCIILKSDGASLYTTSDLATLIQRRRDYNPDKIIYVVDNRQSLHFVQVFRCAYKTGIIDKNTELKFVGFGTMNGKDGKPFKTKDGGNVSLESLINDTTEKMCDKFKENKDNLDDSDINNAKVVAIAALKYADLSNQASKDYIFDVNKFLDFEGNTGPYILYTLVRIKSLIKKYTDEGGDISNLVIRPYINETEKFLQQIVSRFNMCFEEVYNELAPHKLCAYLYELSNSVNRFYHENKVLSEKDNNIKSSWLSLLTLAHDILETGIDLLGFKSVDKM